MKQRDTVTSQDAEIVHPCSFRLFNGDRRSIFGSNPPGRDEGPVAETTMSRQTQHCAEHCFVLRGELVLLQAMVAVDADAMDDAVDAKLESTPSVHWSWMVPSTDTVTLAVMARRGSMPCLPCPGGRVRQCLTDFQSIGIPTPVYDRPNFTTHMLLWLLLPLLPAVSLMLLSLLLWRPPSPHCPTGLLMRCLPASSYWALRIKAMTANSECFRIANAATPGSAIAPPLPSRSRREQHKSSPPLLVRPSTGLCRSKSPVLREHDERQHDVRPSNRTKKRRVTPLHWRTASDL
jgi:hypothetical protein